MEKHIDEKLHTLRHSCSHIMAQAVQKLYPQAKLAIGPAIENGFYYDFDIEGVTLSDENLKEIENVLGGVRCRPHRGDAVRHNFLLPLPQNS